MVGISSNLRSDLNEYAPMYYKAKKAGDKDKSDTAFQEMGFDTMGFDTMGSGSGRIVVDLDIVGHPNLVAKIALPHSQYDGRKQNRREADMWRSASTEEKKFLAEVIESDSDGYWLIMRKGHNKSNYTYDWKSEAKYVLKGMVWEEDIRDENIVEINGEYKICDYGTPP